MGMRLPYPANEPVCQSGARFRRYELRDAPVQCWAARTTLLVFRPGCNWDCDKHCVDITHESSFVLPRSTTSFIGSIMALPRIHQSPLYHCSCALCSFIFVQLNAPFISGKPPYKPCMTSSGGERVSGSAHLGDKRGVCGVRGHRRRRHSGGPGRGEGQPHRTPLPAGLRRYVAGRRGGDMLLVTRDRCCLVVLGGML